MFGIARLYGIIEIGIGNGGRNNEGTGVHRVGGTFARPRSGIVPNGCLERGAGSGDHGSGDIQSRRGPLPIRPRLRNGSQSRTSPVE
ncbi:hypothetical protein D3C75_1165800 [compost metagenome]